jgi:sulfate transport system permease protein
MTTLLRTEAPAEVGPASPPAVQRPLGRATGRVTGAVGPLGYGVVMVWLSVIVLLPLAALTVASFQDGL